MAYSTLRFMLCALLIGMLAGCSLSKLSWSGLFGPSQPSADARWALLPFVNYTDQGDADEQVERMITVLLPSHGIRQVNNFAKPASNKEASFVNEAARLQNAKAWARKKAFDYYLSGEITEWQRGEENSQPVVTLSLTITSLADDDDEVIWTVSGTGTGKPGDTVYDTARGLLNTLMSSMPKVSD
ncbi:hypothetical protein [Zooshikella ganghwensis]|uniref:hypothetical protein n=1 Tax=Zooshikella ganghwensis TaxID=202772 RepID=UPI0003F5523F|nr:hypothetical protein [Zooshikella ganghwensis]